MPSNPISKLRSWFNAATRSGVALPDAMALATADKRGRPSVRYVLLKDVDPRGLVFYTNADSRKGRELRDNPRAALAFYWHTTGKQVRAEGKIEAVSEAESDAYWASRPRGSQIAAFASTQSAPLARRQDLVARYRAIAAEFKGADIPRPRQWRGFRLVPDRIEFWARREPRLHHRELFERSRSGWKESLLQP